MRLIALIIISLFVFGVYWFLKPAPTITNYPSAGTEIIAFGDSLVAGVGATPGNDLVSLLEAEIEQPIVNLGISGDTTADGLARIDTVTSRDAKVVILLLGGNDALRNIPLDTTRENLSRIIVDIQSRGAVVVLLGVRSGILADRYEAMYKELSNTYHTAYVPDVLSGVFGRPTLMADPIHPNDLGYQKIAGRVLPALQSVL
jgi:lysophospholipase L1-like esterase